MAGNIKGITIEFRGDTTKLDKALRTIKNESKGVDSQLRAVNKALRFNPNSTELMAQKQTLLKQKVKSTKDELKAFKNAERELKAKNVDKQSQEWMEVRRNIIQCESKLKHFNGELKKVAAPQLAALGGKFQSAGQKMMSAGRGMSVAGAGMVYAGHKLIEMAQVQSDAENKLTEIYQKRMGATEAAAKSTMELASAIQKEGVIGDEVTLSGAQQLATFAQYPETINKLLPAMDNLLVQQNGLNATAGDATRVANLMGKALMGQTGALSKCGITFTDAQAQVLKFGTEEEKAATLAEVVTQNVGEMNKKFAETDAGKIQQAKNALGDAGERIGAVLLPALAKVAQWLNENIMPKVEALISFMEAHPIIAKIIIAITGLLVVGGPLLIMIGGIVSAVGVLMPVLGAISLPILGIVAAIAAAIVAGILIMKNWNKIKAKAKELGKNFKELGKKLIKPFQTAWTKIKAAIDKIKGLFPLKIGKLMKKLKLPHFSLSWGEKDAGPLGTIKWPKGMSVNWYKRGGIFTKPTLLGGNSGVGEAGAEAALPLSALWKQMDSMNSNLINAVVEGLAAAIGNTNATIVVQVDKKTLVETTAPLFRAKLSELDTKKNRKLGYV